MDTRKLTAMGALEIERLQRPQFRGGTSYKVTFWASASPGPMDLFSVFGHRGGVVGLPEADGTDRISYVLTEWTDPVFRGNP